MTASTLDPLISDFVEWVAREPRPYREVLDAWRTSCPRLTVWEDAGERGFVERVRVPDDRRVVLVRITETGRRLLDDIEVLRAETLRTVLDRLDPAQLDGIATATANLRDALTQAANAPGTTGHDHATDRWRA